MSLQKNSAEERPDRAPFRNVPMVTLVESHKSGQLTSVTGGLLGRFRQRGTGPSPKGRKKQIVPGPGAEIQPPQSLDPGASSHQKPSPQLRRRERMQPTAHALGKKIELSTLCYARHVHEGPEIPQSRRRTNPARHRRTRRALWAGLHQPRTHFITIPTEIFNSPLRFFLFICYKQ